jgi:hypothetical protein
MLTRREFLHTTACVASSATVTLFLSPIGCSGRDDKGYGDGAGSSTNTNPTNPTNPPASCSGTTSTSSMDEGHVHDVCVPATDLSTPPAAGAHYTTTNNSGHTHRLSLSQTQLQAIARGEAVAVTTTRDDGHTHAYSLGRAGVPPPTTSAEDED